MPSLREWTRHKPFERQAWEKAFKLYPNQMELKTLLNRLQNGFRIGLFEKPEPKIVKNNPPTTLQQRKDITKAFLKHYHHNFLQEPFSVTEARDMKAIANPTFGQAKSDRGTRPVLNMSHCSPNKPSISDLLLPEWCTVQYTTIRCLSYLCHLAEPTALA